MSAGAALSLRPAIAGCVKKKHFPGAAWLVARGDVVLAWEAAGKSKLDTVYDIASLTKPLCTAALFLQLMGERALRPVDSVKKFFPQFKSHWLGEATLEQLLLHASGLPAWRPLYSEGMGKAAYLRALRKMPLAYAPGTRVEYSCLGYILLGFVIEKVSHARLDKLFAEKIAAPLGLKWTCFNPPVSWKGKIAPTERGNRLEMRLVREHGMANPNPWRRGVIRGEAHDGNAHYLGGVAGNSGLFSTAWELFLMGRSLLDPDDERVVPARLKPLMFRDGTSFGGGRTYGWLCAFASPVARGSLPHAAVGHHGFTGTAMWLSPADKAVYILLSNRVHPRVKSEGIDGCRREFYRGAVRW